ncbi:MAG: hypothetical protein E7222_12820 [Clostridiales bacterium]|nr:hypothetical protein [Clostridiales bacterium]
MIMKKIRLSAFKMKPRKLKLSAKDRFSAIFGVLYMVMLNGSCANAKGNKLDKILEGANTVKTFIGSIVAIIGFIIFVRNASDFGTAIQDRDRSGLVTGFFGLVGGAVICAAGAIATLFGVS